MIDAYTAWAAVERRDRTFDGRFVTGVLTTGIYCRPSCAARHPRRSNVRFFADGVAFNKGHGFLLVPCSGFFLGCDLVPRGCRLPSPGLLCLSRYRSPWLLKFFAEHQRVNAVAIERTQLKQTICHAFDRVPVCREEPIRFAPVRFVKLICWAFNANATREFCKCFARAEMIVLVVERFGATLIAIVHVHRSAS